MVQIFLTCVYWFTTHVHCYINSICETCRTIACWKVHIQGFQLHKGKHEIRVKSAYAWVQLRLLSYFGRHN